MKFLDKLTLGKKISFLLAAGLVVGIGVFSFLGIRAVNQATEVMLEDRLTTAHLVADYLDNTLGQAMSEVEIVARKLGDNITTINLTTEIPSLTDAFARLSIQANSFYLIDDTGKVLWTRPQTGATSGGGIAYYPGISQVLKDGKSYISSLVSEPLTNTPVILLISPVVSKERQGISGVFIVTIDVTASRVGGFVRPIQLGQTGYVEIVDKNGIVVARTEPGQQLAPFERSDHSGRFAELIAAGKPTRGLCHTCHEPIQKVERKDVLAFVPLTLASWGVIIRQSEEEALAPVYELRQSLILFGILLTAAASLTVIITTRDVINRLKILISASQRIAAGDLNGSISITKQDEVGMLAGAFEDMRAKLKMYYRELEQRTRELSFILTVSDMLSYLPDISDLDTALSHVLEKTREMLKEDIGGILLLDEEKQALHCMVNHGLYRKKSQSFLHTLDEGISSQVVRSGKVITIADISRERRFDSSEPLVSGLQGFISVPILSKGKSLGVLNIASDKPRQFSAEDIRLLEGISRQISTAIENARLHHEVQHKEEIRGELLQDMFSIQEEERKRIARELHDETSQVVASLNASLETAVSLLSEDTEKARTMLEKAQALSINILDDVHKLIYELRPSLLDDLGLVAAARWLAESNLEKAGITVTFNTLGRQRRLSPHIEATLFRVIQEAVNNIARHSRAKNTCINLLFKKNAIRVQIKDDGSGFDVDEAIASKERPRGLGLVGMKERIAIVKGSLEILSRRKRGGTEIVIDIPLEKETSNAEDQSINRR
ncbi:MAG: hypothetical protein A2144_10410 [Chloroflexi bacterium RBG_16_50_9]|nr:MAG: hypothetical protein A2144_10410 [Chloroflexi bacterium RBG_16_50_9]